MAASARDRRGGLDRLGLLGSRGPARRGVGQRRSGAGRLHRLEQVLESGGDLLDRTRELVAGRVGRRLERGSLAAGVLQRGDRRDRLVVRQLDVDQPGVHEFADDVGRLVDGEAALGGEVGDVARAVHLAQQCPVGAAQDDVGCAVRAGRQHRDAALAADGGEQLAPAVATHLDLGQQLAHRHRRRHVLAGLLGLAELVGGDRPLQQRRHGVAQLLDDERLDDLALDVAEVHQQLAEPPALQLVGLDVQGGRQASGDRSPEAMRRAPS